MFLEKSGLKILKGYDTYDCEGGGIPYKSRLTFSYFSSYIGLKFYNYFKDCFEETFFSFVLGISLYSSKSNSYSNGTHYDIKIDN